MPKGTKVARCVQKVKQSGKGTNPYAVCQSATGQSYATGRTLKSNMPKGAEMSPSGDIGMYRVMEGEKAGRQFMSKGGSEKSSKELPYHPESMAIDSSFGPGDKVC